MNSLPASIYGVVYSFLEHEDICHCAQACKNAQRGSHQEYMWQVQVIRRWMFCRVAKYNNSWREAYTRRSHTDSSMLRGKPSDYQMTALSGHKEHITDLAFVGDLIMTGSNDGGITFWLPGAGEDYVSHMFEAHTTPIKQVKLEVQERRAISLSDDGRIGIWDISALPDSVVLASTLQTDL